MVSSMPRQTDTRQRMLRTAAELLRTQGYHATGLNQVLTASAAPKGSLYFHFPGGKEQLAGEALTLAGRELATTLESVLAEAGGLTEGLEAMVDHLAEGLEASNFRQGCPLSTTALDAGADSEPIRQACSGGFDAWHHVLVDHLASHGVEPEAADELATTVLAAVEGALLLARTRRDVTPLRIVGRQLRTLAEGAK
ncbi:transcriptional regulator [Saccharomonospora glauca K62]|uniref:Transcriptional regulator n=2 Tax=Saccharomonospora glauca TaxID=40990 RepID=I1D6L3_9PSEU|nr:transcriptional regulator [Saccharomonospora glauca K62]